MPSAAAPRQATSAKVRRRGRRTGAGGRVLGGPRARPARALLALRNRWWWAAGPMTQHPWQGAASDPLDVYENPLAGRAEDVNVTDEWDEDPESYVMLDKDRRPVEFWLGNYSSMTALACNRSGDLLFDWMALKMSMSSWLRELVAGSRLVMQAYWELIRPLQHSLTNIIAFHNISTSRDCMLGMLAVRVFYLVVQSQEYRTSQILVGGNFAIDWHYYATRFRWSRMIASGWGTIIFSSLLSISNGFKESLPQLSWVDCPADADQLTSLLTRVSHAAEVDQRLSLELAQRVERLNNSTARRCPAAYAYGAVLVALMGLEGDSHDFALEMLDRAQSFIRLYREKNDFTLINILNVQWPLWQTLAAVSQRLTDAVVPKSTACQLLFCPAGGTPNPISCECEFFFPEDYQNVTVCIFMVDTRRKSSLRNITSVLNARYWTLAYGINRAYADDHGYEIEYVVPDSETHFPGRKVGWGKVKVLIDRLRAYGPRRCAYGVSIDTDAYFRSTEPLAAVVAYYELHRSNLILFSQEYHTELRPNRTFINGGFFIVRNSEAGVGLLEEWYNVPDDYREMAHLKKENPQGLNLCWDEQVQPRHAEQVVLAPSYLFTAPLGFFVRHNWFKDLRFEQELQDVLLQRLHRRYGCIVCQNVYDWDESLNIDVGWR